MIRAATLAMPLHALGFYFLCCEKVKSELVFDELFDKRRFSHAPSAIDNNKAAVCLIRGFKGFQLPASADKFHIATSFIIIYFMIISFILYN